MSKRRSTRNGDQGKRGTNSEVGLEIVLDAKLRPEFDDDDQGDSEWTEQNDRWMSRDGKNRWEDRKVLTGTTIGIETGQVPMAIVHPVLHYLHWCFANHLVPSLRAEWFRLMIVHGVAEVVNANPEQHRAGLGVRHTEGKAVIDVVLPANSVEDCKDPAVWSHAGLPTFVKELSTRMDESLVTSLVGQVAVGSDTYVGRVVGCMSAVKAFFDVRFRTKCGFPSLRLLGPREEWQEVADLVKSLRQRSFPGIWELWLSAVDECVGELLKCFDGQANVAFLESLFKYQSRSGGAAISGWITAFFPLAVPFVPLTERKLGWYTDVKYKPVAFQVFPSGMCTAPFSLVDSGNSYPMVIQAGFEPLTNLKTAPTSDSIRIRWHILWDLDRNKSKAEALQ